MFISCRTPLLFRKNIWMRWCCPLQFVFRSRSVPPWLERRRTGRQECQVHLLACCWLLCGTHSSVTSLLKLSICPASLPGFCSPWAKLSSLVAYKKCVFKVDVRGVVRNSISGGNSTGGSKKSRSGGQRRRQKGVGRSCRPWSSLVRKHTFCFTRGAVRVTALRTGNLQVSAITTCSPSQC